MAPALWSGGAEIWAGVIGGLLWGGVEWGGAGGGPGGGAWRSGGPPSGWALVLVVVGGGDGSCFFPRGVHLRASGARRARGLVVESRRWW